MLKVLNEDLVRCGGFLEALADNSVEYLQSRMKGLVSWQPNPLPERLVVHKEPHLDDYLAEMLFRSALSASERPAEFLEMALYSEDDSTARTHWPTAAVFGIGATLPCGRWAQYLFDEHKSGGGRTEDSCAHVVARRCFRSLPASITRILDEVGAVDSFGGADKLHLNNLLKTCHVAQYALGKAASGQAMGATLSNRWKRAVVNALVAGVVYCLDNQIEITEPTRVKECMRQIFGRFSQVSHFASDPAWVTSFERIRSMAGDLQSLKKNARVRVGGIDLPQLLVAPYLATAAREAWGEEIAYFLMSHFWEPQILQNLHFVRVERMVASAFADIRRPRPVWDSQCRVMGEVLGKCLFRNGDTGRGGATQMSSPLWICACQHTNQVLQPNKALQHFITENNFGVGIVLAENTKLGSRVMFKGRGLPDDFWDAVLERIYDAEPGLWYRPQPKTPFVVNGNAAHQYVRRSALTSKHLAWLCREVYG